MILFINTYFKSHVTLCRRYRESISSSFCNSYMDEKVCIPFYSTRVHLDVDVSMWKPPIFEVWVKSDTNHMVLVGLSTVDLDTLKFKEVIDIPIESILSGNIVGTIRLGFILGSKTSKIDEEIQVIIANEKLERLNQPVVSISSLLPNSTQNTVTEIPAIRESLDSVYSLDSLSFPPTDNTSVEVPVDVLILSNPALDPIIIEDKIDDGVKSSGIFESIEPSDDVHILDFVLAGTFLACTSDDTVGCCVQYSLETLKKYGIQVIDSTIMQTLMIMY